MFFTRNFFTGKRVFLRGKLSASLLDACTCLGSGYTITTDKKTGQRVGSYPSFFRRLAKEMGEKMCF